MTATSPQIILNLGGAILDTAASSATHTRADITDLETGQANRFLKYATLEPSFWLLDGSFHFAAEPANIGFASQKLSSVAGVFSPAIGIRLTLTTPVDIEQGITLEFSTLYKYFAVYFSVAYKDAIDTLIETTDYISAGHNYFAQATTLPVPAVKYIDISFTDTAAAYRHLKLMDVFVDGIMYDKDRITAARLVESCDITGVEIPSSTLEATLYSPAGEYDILDPQGVYAALSDEVQLEAYEFIGETRVYLGRFYLEDWNAKTKYEVELVGNNVVHKLGNASYLGDELFLSGHQFDPQLAILLVDYIYETQGFFDAYGIRGALPISNLREALSQMCFNLSYGADVPIVNCNRRDDIYIDTLTSPQFLSSWEIEIPRTEQLQGTNFKLIPLVTKLKLTTHEWWGSAEPVSLLSGSLAAGDYLVKFSVPAWHLVAVNATITSSGGYHAYLNVPTLAFVTLDGDVIKDHQTVVERETTQEYTADNVYEFSNATLVGSNIAVSKLNALYEFFENRITGQVKTFANQYAYPGKSVLVETETTGKSFSGYIVKTDTDLAGGFMSTHEVFGLIIDTP